MIEGQVIIPIAPLDRAKSRLKDLLTLPQRAQLVLHMLEDVSATLFDSDLVKGATVVSTDSKVLEFAKSLGIHTLQEPKPSNLNSALNLATKTLMESSPECSNLILPVDIPLVSKTSLDGVLLKVEENQEMHGLHSFSKIVIAAQSNDGGTNLLLRWPPNLIGLSFGPNSFAKHRNDCLLKKAKFIEWKSADTSLDIDTPQDVKNFMNLGEGTNTWEFLTSSFNHEK
jgi:2-phospho-L-lactate guanylyltransferase